jgi:magnesium-dependent phosphatase 1
MSRKFPKVVAFDLDGTLWAPEMYELWGGGAPFKSHNGEFLSDRKGERVNLLGSSREVLSQLCGLPEYQEGALTIAYVSTCDEPAWARECLTKFLVPVGGQRVTMGEVAAVHEIYKARDKTVHFAKVREATGVAYEDMIFFDNQMIRRLLAYHLFVVRRTSTAVFSAGS